MLPQSDAKNWSNVSKDIALLELQVDSPSAWFWEFPCTGLGLGSDFSSNVDLGLKYWLPE